MVVYSSQGQLLLGLLGEGSGVLLMVRALSTQNLGIQGMAVQIPSMESGESPSTILYILNSIDVT